MKPAKLPFIYPLALFFVFIGSVAHGQTITPAAPTPQVEKALTAVSFNYLGPALTQERRIGPQTTALFGVGAHYSFYSSDSPPPIPEGSQAALLQRGPSSLSQPLTLAASTYQARFFATQRSCCTTPYDQDVVVNPMTRTWW